MSLSASAYDSSDVARVYLHLADESVLVHRTALFAVGHGSLCPHLFLQGASVSARTAQKAMATYDILEDPVRQVSNEWH